MKEQGYNSTGEDLEGLPSQYEDMKNLLIRADEREKAVQKKGVLKENEVDHFYKTIKNNP